MVMLRNTMLIVLSIMLYSQAPLHTMKRTLEGPEESTRPKKRIKFENQKFELICSDGKISDVPASALTHSSVLLNMIKNEESVIAKNIIIDNIDTRTMHIIVNCLKLMCDHIDAPHKTNAALYNQIEKDCFNGFDKKNFGVYQEIIVKLFSAAHYLDIPVLILAIKSVIGNNVSSLFPISDDGKRIITTKFFMDVQKHIDQIFQSAGKPEVDFEQQVAQKGKYAIPGNLVIKKIMPDIVIDLLAKKHGTEPEMIERLLQRSKGFDIHEVIQYWNLIKIRLDREQICEEDLIKLMSSFDEKIVNLLNSLNGNGIDEKALKDQLIEQYKNAKDKMLLLWRVLGQDARAKIFKNILLIMKQVEEAWTQFGDTQRKECINILTSLHPEKLESSINAYAIKTLLSKPSKNLDKAFVDTIDILWIEGLFKKMYTLIEEIAKTTSVIKQAESSIKKNVQNILNSLPTNDIPLMMEIFAPIEQLMNTLKQIDSLPKFLQGSRQSSSKEKFQDPSLQMLVFADTNKTDQMEWLSSYSDYINTKETFTQSTPLSVACAAGRLEAIECILKHKININNPVNAKRDTPLHVACENHNVELVQFLLDNGANPNALNVKKRNPLISLMKYLNDTNSDVVCQIVCLLIKYGAMLNIDDDKKMTVLHVACKNTIIPSYTKVVSLLIENGADLEAQDRNGNTPLISACIRGSLKLVKVLIDKKANVNAKNYDGTSALMIACYFSRWEIVEELLSHYADVTPINNEGKTALDYVGLGVQERDYETANNRIKELLKKCGAL